MAAPPGVTVKNLSGKWTMNKSLCDSQDAFFILQGLSWFTRKAIQLANVSLVIKQYEAEGFVHIDITSTASGLSTTQEDRVLNWMERSHQDKLFGNVKGRSRMIKDVDFQSDLDSITDEQRQFLLAKRLKNGSPSTFLEDEHVQSVAFSQDSGWAVDQLWGFEEINGVRRYTRRLLCKKGGKSEMMRLVYDYTGPLDGESELDVEY